MGLGQWEWRTNLCALPPGQHVSHSSTASVSVRVTDKVICSIVQIASVFVSVEPESKKELVVAAMPWS